VKNLELVLSDFLKEIGRYEDIKLGDMIPDTYQATDADTVRLAGRLNERSLFNRTILVIYVVFLCVLFAIGIFIVFYFLKSPEKMNMVFGGTFLGLIVVNDRLFRIWREKTIIDVILTLIQGLPPMEAVKAIESIYWGRIRRPSK